MSNILKLAFVARALARVRARLLPTMGGAA